MIFFFFNRFEILSNDYFQSLNPHFELFQCLAFIQNSTVCSSTDMIDMMKKYVTSVQTAILDHPSEKTALHPLYFLAESRLSSDNKLLQQILLKEFARVYKDSIGCRISNGGWMTDQEKKIMKGEEIVEVEKIIETLKDKWNQFVITANLKKEQCKPMNELMNMAGLKNVKEIAFDLYNEGYERSLLSVESANETKTPEYNFTFVGNPGKPIRRTLVETFDTYLMHI